MVPSTVLFKDGFTEHEVGVDPLLSPDASRLVCHIKPILGKEAIEEVYLHEFMQLVKTKDILQLACEDANSQSKLFLPEDLVQLILQQLKENAISYLLRKPAVLGLTADQANRPVLSAALHSVVLGVPAHFTEKYKEAIKLAATNAGFDEVSALYLSSNGPEMGVFRCISWSSPPQRRWLTGYCSLVRRPCWYSTWVAARQM